MTDHLIGVFRSGSGFLPTEMQCILLTAPEKTDSFKVNAGHNNDSLSSAVGSPVFYNMFFHHKGQGGQMLIQKGKIICSLKIYSVSADLFVEYGKFSGCIFYCFIYKRTMKIVQGDFSVKIFVKFCQKILADGKGCANPFTTSSAKRSVICQRRASKGSVGFLKSSAYLKLHYRAYFPWVSL